MMNFICIAPFQSAFSKTADSNQTTIKKKLLKEHENKEKKAKMSKTDN